MPDNQVLDVEKIVARAGKSGGILTGPDFLYNYPHFSKPYFLTV
jgi:hypothetical protein